MGRRPTYSQDGLEERLRKNFETLKINAKVMRERYGKTVGVEDTTWGPCCDVEDLRLYFVDTKPRM
jgi:hypothetical protein